MTSAALEDTLGARRDSLRGAVGGTRALIARGDDVAAPDPRDGYSPLGYVRDEAGAVLDAVETFEEEGRALPAGAREEAEEALRFADSPPAPDSVDGVDRREGSSVIGELALDKLAEMGGELPPNEFEVKYGEIAPPPDESDNGEPAVAPAAFDPDTGEALGRRELLNREVRAQGGSVEFLRVRKIGEQDSRWVLTARSQRTGEPFELKSLTTKQARTLSNLAERVDEADAGEMPTPRRGSERWAQLWGAIKGAAEFEDHGATERGSWHRRLALYANADAIQRCDPRTAEGRKSALAEGEPWPIEAPDGRLWVHAGSWLGYLESARRWLDEQDGVVRTKTGEVFAVVDRIEKWATTAERLLAQIDAEASAPIPADERLGTHLDATHRGNR